jgi:hypothetical protein
MVHPTPALGQGGGIPSTSQRGDILWRTGHHTCNLWISNEGEQAHDGLPTLILCAAWPIVSIYSAKCILHITYAQNDFCFAVHR